MTHTNPFQSLPRRMFLLVVAPATAFLAFAAMYHLGADFYSFHSGISVPMRTLVEHGSKAGWVR